MSQFVVTETPTFPKEYHAVPDASRMTARITQVAELSAAHSQLTNDIITEAVRLTNTGSEVFANDLRTKYNKKCILYGV